MKFINELREGEKISGIYLCKHKQPAVTKNGKPYENVILQDKTGTIDAKIWEPNSQGIDDFDTLDYIDVIGDVTSFQGSLQVSIKRARKAHEGEYEPGNYLPISEKSIDGMYEELLKYVHSIKNAYLNKLLVKFFEEDEEFIKTFKGNSAAKTVHHGFIGGLLEHTLGVVRLCQYYSMGGLEEYQGGFEVKQINRQEESVEFVNGMKLYAGDINGKVDEEQIRRIQIRETILSHIDRERRLFGRRIKVLSLFFIDEVARYKKYDETGCPQNGSYADIFEEEYRNIIENMKYGPGDEKYRDYIEMIPVEKTHAGYFSIDRKGHVVDSKGKGKEMMSDDQDAYDLIMKNTHG